VEQIDLYASQPQVKTQKKKSALPIIIAIVVIVLALIAGGLAFYFNTGARRVDRYIATAEKYIDEKDFDKAIAEYEKAIKIDPKNVEAYLGEADAYIKWARVYLKDDDIDSAIECYESAAEVLEKGIEETDDKKLKKKLDRVKELIVDAGGEVKEKPEDEKKVEPVADAEAYYKSFVGMDKTVSMDKVTISRNLNDKADILSYVNIGDRLSLSELNGLMITLNEEEVYESSGEEVAPEYTIITSAGDNQKYLILRYNNFDIYYTDEDYALVVCYFNGDELELIYASVNWARSAEDIYDDGLMIGFGSGGATDSYDWGRVISDGRVIDIYKCETCDPYTARMVDSDILSSYSGSVEDVDIFIEITEMDGEKYFSCVKYDGTGNTTENPYAEYSADTVNWILHDEMVDMVDGRFDEYNMSIKNQKEMPEFLPITETL